MKIQTIKRKCLQEIFPKLCESWQKEITQLVLFQTGEDIEVSNELINRAFKLADKDQLKFLNTYFKIEDNSDIFKKINTYTDFCKHFRVEELSIADFKQFGDQAHKLLAFHKIKNLETYLNSDWKLDFNNFNQRKWYPYFEKASGVFRFDVACCFCFDGIVALYKDEDTARFIGEKFKPIFVKSFISQTYSCIKGRGIHGGLNKLTTYLKDTSNTKYCLKLDIKKFYPSIDNNLLKLLLRKKFKDEKLLNLLDNIIDFIEGLPLGSYTSQFFAAFYLNSFTHWLKETKQIKYLLIYCDDLVILGNNKEYLHNLRKDVELYLYSNLNLSLSNHQVFPVNKRGIDFLGYKSFHTHILLRKTIKHRFIKMIKESNNMKSIASYKGWFTHCNSINLQRKYI